MQIPFPFEDRSKRLAKLHETLARCFGPIAISSPFDPVTQLVWGILSGRTYTEVTLATIDAVRARFKTWEAVRDAPVREIELAIQPVTFSEVKAPRLKEALAQVSAEQGRLSLDHLKQMPVDAALSWLERLPGVGRKASAATINNSSLRMRALVIDSHHLRILKRLRLVKTAATIRDAYEMMMDELPQHWDAVMLDHHHQYMKRLGQTICRHGLPNCRACPLRTLCPTGQTPRERKRAIRQGARRQLPDRPMDRRMRR
ncbi:endonuclease III domain-containing protein [Aestuariibius sp. 2305UL40-4]|uniref:endonuclease III domain-containing protein n=1 Tax=Aestuariibius violaceus TaxID=3234132 RepID=UPI00345E1486